MTAEKTGERLMKLALGVYIDHEQWTQEEVSTWETMKELLPKYRNYIELLDDDNLSGDLPERERKVAVNYLLGRYFGLSGLELPPAATPEKELNVWILLGIAQGRLEFQSISPHTPQGEWNIGPREATPPTSMDSLIDDIHWIEQTNFPQGIKLTLIKARVVAIQPRQSPTITHRRLYSSQNKQS